MTIYKVHKRHGRFKKKKKSLKHIFSSVHFLLNIHIHSLSSRLQPECSYMVLLEFVLIQHFRSLVNPQYIFFPVSSTLPLILLFLFFQVTLMATFFYERSKIKLYILSLFFLLEKAVAFCKAYQEQQACCQISTFPCFVSFEAIDSTCWKSTCHIAKMPSLREAQSTFACLSLFSTCFPFLP